MSRELIRYIEVESTILSSYKRLYNLLENILDQKQLQKILKIIKLLSKFNGKIIKELYNFNNDQKFIFNAISNYITLN